MKSGEGIETEYTVNPVPHKPLDPYIMQCFIERPCNLEALLLNADPFSREWNKFTPLAISENISISVTELHSTEVMELKKVFDQCDPEYKEKLLITLSKLPQPIYKIEDVPQNIFDRIKTAVYNKRDEFRDKLNSVMDSEKLFAV
jgi:hypothetical protein